MAVQVTPLAPTLPATTAIQDPAVRRFAQAVQDALGALRSEAGAVESLNKAAAALSGAAGSRPASIAQWLLTSELYQKLKSEIVAVDVQAKQDLLAEAIARQSAIEDIQATLASIEATPEYDPLATYAIGDMVTYTGKLYRAIAETTGNLPTDLTYWEKIGDYASLGEAVSAHAIKIDDLEYSMYNPAGEVQAEVAARQTLATQMRGAYAGTDITQVTQGLMYSERVARSGADSAEVAARQSLATKVLGQVDPTGLTLAALTSGLIFEEAQVRSDADGSLAQTIDALEVTMGENIEAEILAEQTVRAGNDSALVSAINTAWAFTGATQAVSQSGQNLITNWTAAQANRWSQLEAEVFTAGGQTIRAALAEEASVRANADGSLGAQWTIKTDINGYVAGFGFASTANNATPTSEFIIRADKFAVVMPGYGEHVPFAIGSFGPEFNGFVAPENQPGPNLCPNPDLGGNLSDTTTAPGWTVQYSGSPLYRLRYITSDAPAPPWNKKQPVFYVGCDSADDYVFWRSDMIDVNESTDYCLSCWAQKWSSGTPSVYLRLRCYNASDAYLNTVGVLNGFDIVVSGWKQYHGVIGPSGVSFPVGTRKVQVEWFGGYLQVGYSMATRFGLNEGKVPNRALLPPDLIGQHNPITSSNVTTYIDNAAIGNAQIGGDIWSSNFVAGSAGWRIYRSGSAEFRNITARGNIEASSLKANTLMVNRANIVNAAVDTLQIEGNAVTIPVHARPADVSGIG